VTWARAWPLPTKTFGTVKRPVISNKHAPPIRPREGLTTVEARAHDPGTKPQGGWESEIIGINPLFDRLTREKKAYARDIGKKPQGGGRAG
jgi:hypothetical protein